MSKTLISLFLVVAFALVVACVDVTPDELKAILPNLATSKKASYAEYMNDAMDEGDIDSCCEIAAFIAQVGHESGDLNWFVEFASGSAYEGRKDLGNTQKGDGVRYKGRGPIQITGRANYRAAGQALGIDLENNPLLAQEPIIGFKTAVWFWNSRNLNRYADCTQANFDVITKRINGGYNGKADRDAKFAKAKKLLKC